MTTTATVPCSEPGCPGTIEDGYCNVCGAPAGGSGTTPTPAASGPTGVPAPGCAAAATPSAPLHLPLSDDDVAELDRRILAVLDEYVASDADRHDRPLHRGLFVLHRPPS